MNASSTSAEGESRSRGEVIALESEETFRFYRGWRFLGGSVLCMIATFFGGVAPLLAVCADWDPLGLRVGLRETGTLVGYVVVVLIALLAGLSVLADGLTRVRGMLHENGIVPVLGRLLGRRGGRFIPFEDVVEVDFVHSRGNDFCNLRTANESIQVYLNAMTPKAPAIRRLRLLKEQVDSRRSAQSKNGQR